MSERRYITFSVGEHRFAVPIDEVREILNAKAMLSIPGSREPLQGIIPYRGETVLPVFSLLGFLGRPGAGKASDLIVVTGAEGSPVGFTVGSMGSVLVTSGVDDEIASYEGDLEAPEGVITGVLRKSGGDHILLEIARVLGG